MGAADRGDAANAKPPLHAEGPPLTELVDCGHHYSWWSIFDHVQRTTAVLTACLEASLLPPRKSRAVTEQAQAAFRPRIGSVFPYYLTETRSKAVEADIQYAENAELCDAQHKVPAGLSNGREMVHFALVPNALPQRALNRSLLGDRGREWMGARALPLYAPSLLNGCFPRGGQGWRSRDEWHLVILVWSWARRGCRHQIAIS